MSETDVMATLVLRVPPNRIGQLRAVVSGEVGLARVNASYYEKHKKLYQAKYWREEEEFWKSIWEQLQ